MDCAATVADCIAYSSSSHTNRESSHQPDNLSVRALCHPTPARELAALATAATARSLPIWYDPTRKRVLGSLASSLRVISPIAAHTSSWSGNFHCGAQYVVSNRSSSILPCVRMSRWSAGSSRTRRAARKSPVCSTILPVALCRRCTSTEPGQWLASMKVASATSPSPVGTSNGTPRGIGRTMEDLTPMTAVRSAPVTGEQYIGAGPLKPACRPHVWSEWKCVRK